MMYLANDIYCSHHRTRYGCRGDPVTIVAEHGDVLIVEAAGKERFSVRKIDITNDQQSGTDVQNIDTNVPTNVTAIVRTRPKTTRSKERIPPTQSELF